jgi:hypothetical protein|tara:strand:+ start:1404 stop:1997 length:594 start_codon:yes stop_codon:yes gene_type:complete
MGILKSAADVVYTIRFLKLLVTKFEETDAFKYGIIDADGKKVKDYDMGDMQKRDNYRNYYTSFHRLVYNLKRLMAKVPGGQSIVARYGAALALIKEDGDLSDRNLQKIHEHTGVDILDVLMENSHWYVLDDGNLGQGVYKMANESLTDTAIEFVRKGDKVRVEEDNLCHDVLGISIYEGTHLRTGRRVLFSANEIMK